MLGDEMLVVAMIDCAVYHGCFVRFSGPSRRMDGRLCSEKRPNDGCGARWPGVGAPGNNVLGDAAKSLERMSK